MQGPYDWNMIALGVAAFVVVYALLWLVLRATVDDDDLKRRPMISRRAHLRLERRPPTARRDCSRS